MIFTDWVIGWDSVTKCWHKVHITMDSEKLAQHYMTHALRRARKKHIRHGLIVSVGEGVRIEADIIGTKAAP